MGLMRKGMFVAMLGGSVGVPYAMWNGGDVSKMATSWYNAATTATQTSFQPGGQPGTPLVKYGPNDTLHEIYAARPDVSQPDVVGMAYSSVPPLAGPTVQDLAEVLRFDVSPEWVTARWSRVSSTLAETNLEGLRVALVTGTNVDDLSGSLTYYFDRQNQLQRITLHGTTGDENKLVQILTQYYGFKAEPTLGAGLYMIKWNGQPMSVLRVRHAPVMWATSPNTRLEVLLEINRPGKTYGLSAAAKTLIEQDKGAKLW